MTPSGICEYCHVRYRDDNDRFCDRCGAPLPGIEPDYWRTVETQRQEKYDTISGLCSTAGFDDSDIPLLSTGDGLGVGYSTDTYRWGDPRLHGRVSSS